VIDATRIQPANGFLGLASQRAKSREAEPFTRRFIAPKEQRISAKGKTLKRVAALVCHARNIMRSEGTLHRVMRALCGVPSGRNVFLEDVDPMVSPWAGMNRPVRTMSIESDAAAHGFTEG
jgi:hypothetical protein